MIRLTGKKGNGWQIYLMFKRKIQILSNQRICLFFQKVKLVSINRNPLETIKLGLTFSRLMVFHNSGF